MTRPIAGRTARSYIRAASLIEGERATRVTSKGQVTIPKQVRTHLGIKPGDRVGFSVVPGGAVELRPENDREALRRAIEDVMRRRPMRLGMSTDEYMALIRDEQ